MTTTTTHTDDRQLFADASPADLRDLAELLRGLGTAIASAANAALEAAACTAEQLADAKIADENAPADATLAVVQQALSTATTLRRSVADMLAYAPEPAAASGESIAETNEPSPEQIPADVPAITPEPTRPPTMAERESAKREDHDASVAAARELLARPLEPGDDALALLASMAETLRTMPRAEFGRTHTRRRQGGDAPDAVEELWHALNARAARIAVAAHAAGASPRTVTEALDVPLQRWFAIRDTGEAAGPIRRDPEYGPWVAAARSARGLS